MDTFADALDSPWDALPVTEPARDIPALAAAERRLPDRPRVILTDDQLHAEHVIWAMGATPSGGTYAPPSRTATASARCRSGSRRTTPTCRGNVSQTRSSTARSGRRVTRPRMRPALS